MKFNDVSLLHEAIGYWADRTPDAIALEFEGEAQSWANLRSNVARAATALKERGIGAGSRVGILSKNSPAMLELLFAAGMLGASVTPVNWRLAPPEVAYILSNSEVEVLFIEGEFRGALEDHLSGVHSLQEVLSADFDDYCALIAPLPEHLSSTADSDDIALILYSSGTTGRPKGVTISHRAMLWRTKNGDASAAFPQSEEERSRLLVALPMFHIGALGSATRLLTLGHRIHVLREAKVPLMMDAIKSGDTNVFMAPAVLQAILEKNGEIRDAMAHLRDLSYGSAPMPPSVLDQAMAAWPSIRFAQGYGSTETVGSATVLTHEHHRDRVNDDVLRSVGKPVHGAEVRVVNPETGVDQPQGADGEIWIRAPFNATGYYKDDAATEALFAVGGWLRTGDIGRFDSQGFLYMRDRMKDMIISGGENIYSLEVEHALTEYPGVQTAAVVGVPHEKWGERPVAFIEVEHPAGFDLEGLEAFMRSRLAHFKCPDRYFVLDAMPRNAAGKVLKRELRSRGMAESC